MVPQQFEYSKPENNTDFSFRRELIAFLAWRRAGNYAGALHSSMGAYLRPGEFHYDADID